VHIAKPAIQKDWIATNCSEFFGKDKCHPNSSDLSRRRTIMPGELCLNAIFQTKPENIDKLNEVLQLSDVGPSATTKPR